MSRLERRELAPAQSAAEKHRQNRTVPFSFHGVDFGLSEQVARLLPRSQFPALASDWRTPWRDTRFPWQRPLVECRIAVSARSDGVAPGGHRFAAVAAHHGLRASAFFRTPPKTNIAFLCYNSSSFVLHEDLICQAL